MKYKRFFAFGCSFTSYCWPTWADYLGLLVEEYYNYGAAGVGNTFIYSQFLRANAYYKFNKDDLIIIAWSSPFRYDYQLDINRNKWDTILFNDQNVKLPPKDISNIITDKNLIANTVNNIYSSFIILSSLNLNYFFTSMDVFLDFNSNNLYPSFYNIKDAKWVNPINLYNSFSNKILIDYFDGKIPDNHPSPKNHLEFLKNELYNKLGIDNNKQQLLENKMNVWQDIYNSSDINSKLTFSNVFLDTYKSIRFNFINDGQKISKNYSGMIEI
jgi:hypothetical protein